MVHRKLDFNGLTLERDILRRLIWRMLPSFGNVLFTLLVVAGLLYAGRVGALPLGEPAAPALFPSQLNYQGYVRDLNGTPLDGTYDMIFRLYDAPTDGNLLWEEHWTAANNNNQVTVTEGLFNVALGRLNPITADVLNHHALYVGISIDGDLEASPREQLTMVPYAWSASTVVDGAITTAKLADNAVTSAKIQDAQITSADLASDAVTSANIQDGQVGNADLANNAVNSAKIQDGQVTSADIENNTIIEDDIADNFKARDADKLDGKNSSDFATSGHNHDNRYYTESESDSRFAYASHNHDSRYYTESESNNRFVNAGGDSMSGNLDMAGNRIISLQRIDLQTANSDWARIEGHGQGTFDDGGIDFNLGDDTGVAWRWNVNGSEKMKLDGSGNLTVARDLVVGSWIKSPANSDLVIDAGGDRGDGGRALVQTGGDTLTINFNNDFAGGVRINDLRTGKVVEENLMTVEEQEDLSLLDFAQGDLLCWNSAASRLARCEKAASPLVVAVADEKGKPIVLGVELVKVLGPVKAGDLLVASEVPGYAQVNNQPAPGTVIAKALEDFAGKRGAIKAMIHSF